MTASFWDNAPWRSGRAGHRMGLRPITIDAWLNEPITAAYRAEKERLLADPAATVFAELPESNTAQACVLRLIEAALGVTGDASRPPLVAAALLVPDDLCIMTRDATGYRLTAASLSAPSYWRLLDKIGQPLDAIHAPVAGLNDRLGALMSRFFEQLPEGRAFERRNWLIHTSESLYHPAPEPWETLGQAPAVSTLVVRSERQTLRRIDADHVVFTIRVSCHPLAEIAAHEDSARDLLATIESLDDAERQAMSTAHWAPSVIPFLERISRGHAA